jgi:ribosomal protein S6--L-glutamate ligase
VKNGEKILVVGRSNWPNCDPDNFLCISDLSAIEITFRHGRLSALGGADNFLISGVIWQVQLELPSMRERALLEIIRYSRVPCVNTPTCLLAYTDRIASLSALKDAGFPVIDQEIAIGKYALMQFEPRFPAVIKVGNHHCGFGKAKVSSKDFLVDALDLAAAAEDYVCFERFIEYTSDVRYLLVGSEVFVVERIPTCWKANVSPKEVVSIKPDPVLAEMAKRAADVLGASVVGVDFIRDVDGRWHMLEVNLIPGLNGMGACLEPKIVDLLECTSSRCVGKPGK